MRMTNRAVDLPVGSVVGKLTILSTAKESDGAYWSSCVCLCGTRKSIRTNHLTRGLIRSCGCLRYDRPSPSITHGRYKTPEYYTWVEMKKRCALHTTRYGLYKTKGIKVCDRWLNSFENFYADMGSKPAPKHSIDRIDTNGHYTPENCRWATPLEQANNRTCNFQLVFEGKRRTPAEWSRIVGISGITIRDRIKRGWTVRETLTTPIRAVRHRKGEINESRVCGIQ
jgi:hypothetical protein